MSSAFLSSARQATGADQKRDPAASGAQSIWPVLAVTLAGLALRLFYLNHESVGFDEAFSIAACRASMAEMMRRLIADFVHPPLHYLVLRGWLGIFGSNILAARMLSVLFGTLAIPLLYLFARYLFDRRTAWLASMLLAISQIEIMFAQEARPYAQFLFFFLACCYLFTRALYERNGRLWCGSVGMAILLIYTHYFGLFVLGALALFALVYRKQYSVPLGWWIAAAAVTALAYLPWLTSGIFQAAAHAPKTFSGKNSYWSVGGSTFFTAMNFFSNGKPTGLLGSSPLWTIFGGGTLFVAPAAFAFYAARGKAERRNAVLAAMLWVLPVLAAVAAGLAHFQYNVRYVAFCAAPYYILVGRGIAALKPAAVRALLIVLLVAYTANSLRANYFMPRKEDFRGTGAYIRQNLQPGDCAVFYPGFATPQQWNITQGDVPGLRVLHRDDFASGVNACGRVWAVTWSISGNPWQLSRAVAERQELETTHAKIGGKDFFWVHVGLYSRKQP